MILYYLFKLSIFIQRYIIFLISREENRGAKNSQHLCLMILVVILTEKKTKLVQTNINQAYAEVDFTESEETG